MSSHTSYVKVMEYTDPLTLSVIFVDGYEAAQAGETRTSNPWEGPFAIIWDEGWHEGDAVHYWIKDAFLQAYP